MNYISVCRSVVYVAKNTTTLWINSSNPLANFIQMPIFTCKSLENLQHLHQCFIVNIC